jgi:hypothetical protein
MATRDCDEPEEEGYGTDGEREVLIMRRTLIPMTNRFRRTTGQEYAKSICYVRHKCTDGCETPMDHR